MTNLKTKIKWIGIYLAGLVAGFYLGVYLLGNNVGCYLYKLNGPHWRQCHDDWGLTPLLYSGLIGIFLAVVGITILKVVSGKRTTSKK